MESIKSISIALLIGAVVFGLVITAPPCSAAFLKNGTLYYADIPTNDPYESVVMPGDTIVLGRTYDLTKVYGVSKTFAWWKDPDMAGSSCTPELIIPIGYVQTNGNVNPTAVTLDPKIWRTGSYWQWDGCFEKANYKQGHPDLVPYESDNNLAFKVIYDPHPTPIPTPTVLHIRTLISTPPIEEIVITPEKTVPIAVPVKTEEETPWYVWIGAGIGGFIVLRVLW